MAHCQVEVAVLPQVARVAPHRVAEEAGLIPVLAFLDQVVEVVLTRPRDYRVVEAVEVEAVLIR